MHTGRSAHQWRPLHWDAGGESEHCSSQLLPEPVSCLILNPIASALVRHVLPCNATALVSYVICLQPHCHNMSPSLETSLLPCADTCHLISLSGWVPLQPASLQDWREPAPQRRGDRPGAWFPCHRYTAPLPSDSYTCLALSWAFLPPLKRWHFCCLCQPFVCTQDGPGCRPLLPSCTLTKAQLCI